MTATDFLADTYIGTVYIRTRGRDSKCVIKERFEPLFTRTFQCGAGFKRTITRRMGISREDHEKLQGLVAYELGMESIAALKLHIAAEINKTIRFEIVDEVAEEYTFPVDQCDRREMQLLQKKRLYEFWCTSSLFFGLFKRNYRFTLIEWLDEVAEQCSITRYHPDCGCNAEIQSPLGFVFLNIARKISLIAPYFAGAGGDKVVSLVDFIVPEGFGAPGWTDSVPASAVPPYLLFLAGERNEGHLSVVGNILPAYMWSAELSKAAADGLENSHADVTFVRLTGAAAAVGDFIKQRPLVTAAIVVGLGIAFGLLTSSRRGLQEKHLGEDDEPRASASSADDRYGRETMSASVPTAEERGLGGTKREADSRASHAFARD